MPISQDDMYYTWLAQGVSGTPYNLKATEIQTKTYPPNPALPAYPDKTIDVYISQPYNIIMSWGSDTDYYSFSNSGQTIPFFYPTNKINDIDHLNIVGTGGGNVSIQAVKSDNTVVSTYTTTLSPLVYEANSVDPVDTTLRSPVYLTIYAKMFGASKKVGFGIAGKFSDHVGINDYPLLQNVLYDCGTGDISSDLSYMLLDESMITDSEGGAPTGEPEGGGGLYDYPFTAIPEPQLPSVSVCDTGMISLYNTNSSQMYQLANKLWSRDFFDNIIKNFQSPMDNIVSLHVVPFTVYGGIQSDIHIGNYDTDIPSNRLESSYFNIDCGIIELTGAYQSFADYAPFTDIQLYLPYIGIVPLTPDDIIDGAINVKYNIDVFSGACVAYIMSRIRGVWTCINQYQGSIVTQYPITGADYTNVYVGLAMGTAKVLTGTAMLNSLPTMNASAQAGNDITNAVGGAGQITGGVSQMLTAKPTYQRSGGISSSAGLMSVQKPYLIISKPKYIQASNFREQKGYISNLTCTIGNESGFLSSKVTNEQLNDINCTITERDMIRAKLSEGVYV